MRKPTVSANGTGFPGSRRDSEVRSLEKEGRVQGRKGAAPSLGARRFPMLGDSRQARFGERWDAPDERRDDEEPRLEPANAARVDVLLD